MYNAQRRNVLKSLLLLCGGIALDAAPFNGYAKGFAVLTEKQKKDLGMDVLDFLSPNYVYIDDFKENEILIQAYEFELGKNYSFAGTVGKKIVILCQHLTVNGLFENPGGNLTIFCNKITAINSARLSLDGLQNITRPVKQPSTCDGNSPDGTAADNVDPAGNKYNLDGNNAGFCNLYFSTMVGALIIDANGSSGVVGEEGGDACNGANGAPGRNDSGCPNCSGGTRGGDGVRPGNNGDGAAGGKGGLGGGVKVYSGFKRMSGMSGFSQSLAVYFGSSIAARVAGGVGGAGGKGGTAITHGGAGGAGGTHKTCWESGLHDTCRTRAEPNYPNGLDRTAETGNLGKSGADGTSGGVGGAAFFEDNYALLAKIPSSFMRLLLMKAEHFYINNNFQGAIETLSWIIGFKDYLSKNSIDKFSCSSLSTYLEDEALSQFSPGFYKAEIYLNQLNLGYDFFGNPNNYVTLLDSDFINEKILSLYNYVVDFETLTAKVFKKNKFTNKVKVVFSLKKRRTRPESISLNPISLN